MVTWLMMQLYELLGAKRQRSVGPAFVVNKFDFVNARREGFNDCADLPPPEAVRCYVFQ